MCPAHTMGSGRVMNDWTVDKGNAFRSSDEYQCVQIYALKTKQTSLVKFIYIARLQQPLG